MKIKLLPTLLPLLLLLLLLTASLSVPAQSRRVAPASDRVPVKTPVRTSAENNTDGFYFDITRPDCCRLTDAKWRSAAAVLNKSGIPAFFGLYDVLDYKQAWHPVALKRTASDEGWLILGPFASESKATAALNRLPKLLPRNTDEFSGVQTGPTGDAQTWQIGMYQINGFRTNQPVTDQKPETVHKPGVLEAVVIEKNEGASGYGITVEAKGIRYYIYMEGNGGGVKTIAGDVETIGNRVRINYKSIRKGSNGGYILDAVRVAEIKK